MEDGGLAQTYAIHAPAVICEVVEGDMILVHFESGFYFSVRGLGAEIGQRLLAGAAPESIARELAAPSASLALCELLVPIGRQFQGRRSCARPNSRASD